MFERRLKLVLLVLAIPALAVAFRLVQLQVVQAGAYQADAARILLNPVRLYPFLRGDITDQSGKTKLAYDAPSWSICVQYGVIANDNEYLHKFVKDHPERAANEAELKRQIAASWQAISNLTRTPIPELERTREGITQWVQKRKKIISDYHKIPIVLEEERMAHAVVEELNNDQQIRAREALRDYDWVEVVGGQTRHYAGGPAVGQFLGRLHVPSEPDKDDLLPELTQYRVRDRRGFMGIEAMGEQWLRGRRGRLQEDRAGDPVGEVIEPQNGKNLKLTIDLPLQQEVYQLLKVAVDRTQFSTGGSAVLLDIPSREVIAMVSYPSYDPDIEWKDWLTLAEDDLHEPTVCRAYQKLYPPGSIVKPMVLASALTAGKLSLNTHFTCEGRLLEDQPKRWRCDGIHGEIDPIAAVQRSCNVFFYKTGELLGSELLAHWMSQFGLGKPTGIGLPQEAAGHLPTAPNPGYARMAGIGQGEVDVTPLQAANMMATLASGVYRPISIWADNPTPRPATRLNISDETWRAVREAMFRVVNQEHGTAFEYGRLVDAGDYILMGKTGTAQVNRRVMQRMFTCHLADGSTKEEAGVSRLAMQHKYPGAEISGGRPLQYSPPELVEDPVDSWFVGYITSKKHYLDSNNGGDLHVAVAVVVEYGEHGGRTAAPVARDMMRALLNRQTGGVSASTDGGGR